MPQRRYTQEQKQRIIESGEKTPEFNGLMPDFLERAQANIMSGIMRAPSDMATMLGYVPSIVKAVSSSEVDLPEAVLGKEGLDEIQGYVASRTQEELQKLPEERRTDKNAQVIQQTVMSSQAVEDIRLKHSNALVRSGTNIGNAINEFSGLNPIRQETMVDDIEQLTGAAIVPTPGLAGRVGTKAVERSIGRRVAEGAAGMALPGTSRYTPTGIATNVAGGAAVTEAGRRLTDQPAITTGDAFGAEAGVTFNYEPQEDDDQEAGMNVEDHAGLVAGASGAAVGIAVLAGKANRLKVKPEVDEIDDIDVKKVFTPEDQLDETLSGTQKATAGFDDAAPIRDTLANAVGGNFNNPEFNKYIGDIERTINDTSGVNTGILFDMAMKQGNLPGLDKPSVPISKLELGRNQLGPEGSKLFDEWLISKQRMDEYNLKMEDAETAARAARLGIKRQEAQAAKAEMASEDYDIGGGMTVKKARELDALAKNDPRLMQLETAYRKVSNDLLDSGLKSGLFTQEIVDKLKRTNPNFVNLVADVDAGTSTSMKVLSGIRQLFSGTDIKERSGPSIFGSVRTPVAGKESAYVQNAVAPIDAMKLRAHDQIEFTAKNNAKKAYVNTMRQTTDWGRSVREYKTISLDEFMRDGFPTPPKGVKRDNTDVYYDTDGLHFFEVADPLTHKALQFNKPITAGLGFNVMRKLAQQGTTGWRAPEFAPTSAYFDYQMIKATRQPGRSFGLIDANLRKMFPDNALLDRALNKVVDPTQVLPMVNAAFQGIKYYAVRDASLKIAKDLERSSGMFNQISKLVGPDVLVNIAEAGIRSVNQTRYAQAINHRALDAHLLDDPLREVRAGFDAVGYVLDKAGPIKSTFNTYRNMLDVIHNTSKYSFFAQNLAILEKKYGKGNIPEAQIDKLASETRRSSGDMTRSPGNWHLAKGSSMVPYGNIAINSMMHLGQSIKRDPINIGSRIMTGAVMPKVAAIYFLSQNEQLSDWYWNELTSWQRMSSIPVIGPGWWMDLAKGNQRPLEKSDIYLMRETPEISMISNQVVNMVRAMGMFGGESQNNTDYLKEFGKGLESVTSVAPIPLMQAIMGGAEIDFGKFITSPMTGDPIHTDAYLENPQQKNNPQGINNDSGISRMFSNVLTAFFGVATENLISAVDTGYQSYEDNGSITEAFKKAFQFDTYMRERRLLEVPGTREAGATLYTGGQRRHYAGTARRQRVVSKMDTFDVVRKQLSAEKDTRDTSRRAERAGLEGFAKIGDPQVKQLASMINDQLAKGKMKKLSDQRSSLNADMVLIDSNKENMSPKRYHLESVAIRQQINAIDEQQEDIIIALEDHLAKRYGEAVSTIEKAVDVIKGSLTQ